MQNPKPHHSKGGKELTPKATRQAWRFGLQQACLAGQAQPLAGGPVQDNSYLWQEEWVSASKHPLPGRWTQKDPKWDLQHTEKAKAVKPKSCAVPLHSPFPQIWQHKKMRLQVLPPSAGLSQEHSARADGSKLTQGQRSSPVEKQPGGTPHAARWLSSLLLSLLLKHHLKQKPGNALSRKEKQPHYEASAQSTPWHLQVRLVLLICISKARLTQDIFLLLASSVKGIIHNFECCCHGVSQSLPAESATMTFNLPRLENVRTNLGKSPLGDMTPTDFRRLAHAHTLTDPS